MEGCCQSASCCGLLKMKSTNIQTSFGMPYLFKIWAAWSSSGQNKFSFLFQVKMFPWRAAFVVNDIGPAKNLLLCGMNIWSLTMIRFSRHVLQNAISTFRTEKGCLSNKTLSTTCSHRQTFDVLSTLFTNSQKPSISLWRALLQSWSDAISP